MENQSHMYADVLDYCITETIRQKDESIEDVRNMFSAWLYAYNNKDGIYGSLMAPHCV